MTNLMYKFNILMRLVSDLTIQFPDLCHLNATSLSFMLVNNNFYFHVLASEHIRNLIY